GGSGGRVGEGGRRAVARGGVPRAAVETDWVPGSFELPQAALALARTGRYAGIVCVGAVIKGETPHWDYVASAAAQGIARAALDSGVPMSFGVITALTTEQAWARAGGAGGNRGQEAALAALEMAGWFHALSEAAHGRSDGKPARGHRGDRRNGRSRSRSRRG